MGRIDNNVVLKGRQLSQLLLETRMTGENMQPLTGPAFGAATGALLGTVVGWTVYLVRISPPAP